MPQEETVALEIDRQQVMDPRGPKVQESVRSKVTMEEAQKYLRCDYREEGV